jgi:hypothetical protein
MVFRDELIFCCEIKLIVWQTAVKTRIILKGFSEHWQTLPMSLDRFPLRRAAVAPPLCQLAPTLRPPPIARDPATFRRWARPQDPATGPSIPLRSCSEREASRSSCSATNRSEVGRLWDALSDRGAAQRCGWLKDRYGISWQIVPPVLPELLGERDPTKARRVMEAMLQMSKLDIAGLEAAHAGRPRDAATTGELQCSH